VDLSRIVNGFGEKFQEAARLLVAVDPVAIEKKYNTCPNIRHVGQSKKWWPTKWCRPVWCGILLPQAKGILYIVKIPTRIFERPPNE